MWYTYLRYYIRSVLKGCQIGWLCKVWTTPQCQFENGINLNYTSMTKLSSNIKDMYRAGTGNKFILVVTDGSFKLFSDDPFV